MESHESLEDTLLDLAGYSILGLKWLKEYEDESLSRKRQRFGTV